MKYRFEKENKEDPAWYKLTKEINKSVVDDIEELQGLKPHQEREMTKALNLQKKLNTMCILSIVTTVMALTQIFAYLTKGERLFVLTTYENLALRLCFIAVILLIGVKDIN